MRNHVRLGGLVAVSSAYHHGLPHRPWQHRVSHHVQGALGAGKNDPGGQARSRRRAHLRSGCVSGSDYVDGSRQISVIPDAHDVVSQERFFILRFLQKKLKRIARSENTNRMSLFIDDRNVL